MRIPGMRLSPLLGIFIGSPAMAATESVIRVLASNDRLHKFWHGLKITGLEEQLKDDSRLFNVFAPSNEALETLPDYYFTHQYSRHLRNILAYHIESGPKSSVKSSNRAMMNGEDVSFDSGSWQVGPTFTGERTSAQSLSNATNGAVYLVESMLIPSFYRSSMEELTSNLVKGSFQELFSLAKDRHEGQEGYTALIPTDTALAEFESEFRHILNDPIALKGVLELHFVQGILNTNDADQDSLGNVSRGSISNMDGTLAMDGIIYTVDSVKVPSRYIETSDESSSTGINDSSALLILPIPVAMLILLSQIRFYCKKQKCQKYARRRPSRNIEAR